MGGCLVLIACLIVAFNPPLALIVGIIGALVMRDDKLRGR